MKFLDLSLIINDDEDERIIINAQNILYIEPVFWQTYTGTSEFEEGFTSEITMINGQKFHVSDDPDFILKEINS